MICECIYFILVTAASADALMETPRFRGMNSELDNWMEWIDNQMSEDAFEPPSIDDFEKFTGGQLWKNLFRTLVIV